MLSGLETIKLGVGYKLGSEPISSVPSTIEELEAVEVVYEELPGWKEDISKVPTATLMGRAHDWTGEAMGSCLQSSAVKFGRACLTVSFSPMHKRLENATTKTTCAGCLLRHFTRCINAIHKIDIEGEGKAAHNTMC